jgi:hypothetical protein
MPFFSDPTDFKVLVCTEQNRIVIQFTDLFFKKSHVYILDSDLNILNQIVTSESVQSMTANDSCLLFSLQKHVFRVFDWRLNTLFSFDLSDIFKKIIKTYTVNTFEIYFIDKNHFMAVVGFFDDDDDDFLKNYEVFSFDESWSVKQTASFALKDDYQFIPSKSPIEQTICFHLKSDNTIAFVNYSSGEIVKSFLLNSVQGLVGEIDWTDLNVFYRGFANLFSFVCNYNKQIFFSK